jgi:ribosomal protection tetracycline resistance protein
VPSLNLGILAHVDAGKTSLTERLLYAAGVIDEIGSVDAGNTRTDSLALERQRGITIKSAVVSFPLDGVTVNLIDTPGHPDFIAEVERVLGVLDGAVLVVSAVEGVQPQTRVLMRTLRRLRLPTLIFVNKLDRGGADLDRTLRDIAARLTPDVVAMTAATGLGTRGARTRPRGESQPGFTARLMDLLAQHDDRLLADYVTDETAVPYRRLRAELATQTRQALVHPVYAGSAVTGAGADTLIAGIRELLPATAGDPRAPLSGTVFKIERGPAGEKIAYVRIAAGTLRTRDRPTVHRGGGQPADGEGRSTEEGAEKVTAISVFEHGTDRRRVCVEAGRIGKVWGLAGVRIGDTIGEPPGKQTAASHFAPPTLETVVAARRAADRGALHSALTQLAEQDPLIGLRRDEARQEIAVSLYGEVQKEVIQATLADEFGVEVEFRETTTLHIERPAGTGAAFEVKEKGGNPFLATVGLRVEPAPVGSGVEFRRAVELGSLPYSFFKAVEETVSETLLQGLHGWQVTDCLVTMTHSGYNARQSHAHAVFDKSMSSTSGDFRQLTPLVLMDALREAGTVVYEPMHRFRLEIPAELLGTLLPALTRLRAVPRAPATHGDSYLLEGDIPAARVHDLEQQLPTLTRGEGVLESAFDHYQPVTGPVPERARTDHNPLNRKEYLVAVQRRLTGLGESG